MVESHGNTYHLSPVLDGKLARIHRWLSAPDPYPNYQKALKQRQADTGIWFLKSEQYAKWKTDSAFISLAVWDSRMR